MDFVMQKKLKLDETFLQSITSNKLDVNDLHIKKYKNYDK